jgi:hypothetical protein
MDLQKTVRQYDEAAAWLARQRGDDRFDFGVAMNRRHNRLHLQRSGRRLECGQEI